MNRRAQTARRRRRRGGIAETGFVAAGGACWGVGEDPAHCHRASVERYRVKALECDGIHVEPRRLSAAPVFCLRHPVRNVKMKE